jgi:hypothetical protein
LIFCFSSAVVPVLSQQIRPGVWAGDRIESFPIPTTGYHVYFFGELHGLKENVDLQLAYLGMLVPAHR